MTRLKPHSPSLIFSRFSLVIIFYLFLSFGVAVVGGAIVKAIITVTIDMPIHPQKRDLQILKRLQSYINENELTTEDSDSIRTWNNEHPYVYLKLYVEGRVFYDTEMRSPSGQNSQTRPFLSYSKDGGYPLIFKDRTIQANITVYYSLLFKTALRMGILILGFIIFILVFILLLHHKIRYIKIIEKGLKIIETGSLEYQIPVRGKDELASLAVSINNMSQALYERLEAEESLKQEKSQIVTSLSHDIRTPLTSVICYLDLISDKRYDSPQKMEDYLHKARDKAYQMKEMADNLFEHTLASNEAIPFQYETVDGNELVGQLVSEYIYLLEDQHFTVDFQDSIETAFKLKADIHQLRRVFDNLCSNAVKYAATETPIRLKIYVQNQMLHIIQSNAIRKTAIVRDSSGIGVKTCQIIARRHEGSCTSTTSHGDYRFELLLPVMG
ncbi:sensor histidine kinase [Bianquea renquensis]|uniref:histidine kinase n=1 Tax=Bianquea renquensis TaxID=2763661 RepID=A0A926DQA3_9FIRM|nr:HAMP domain-containing sensor histidine kinase [Bianquea renquensis]MBC8542036.1 HAMP domain-containing histidine kinase [Bianquea renquensis]